MLIDRTANKWIKSLYNSLNNDALAITTVFNQDSINLLA